MVLQQNNLLQEDLKQEFPHLFEWLDRSETFFMLKSHPNEPIDKKGCYVFLDNLFLTNVLIKRQFDLKTYICISSEGLEITEIIHLQRNNNSLIGELSFLLLKKSLKEHLERMDLDDYQMEIIPTHDHKDIHLIINSKP